MAAGKELGDSMMGYRAQQIDVGGETKTADQAPEALSVGTVHGHAAGNRQPPAAGGEPVQGADQDVQTFPRDHIGDAENAKGTC